MPWFEFSFTPFSGYREGKVDPSRLAGYVNDQLRRLQGVLRGPVSHDFGRRTADTLIELHTFDLVELTLGANIEITLSRFARTGARASLVLKQDNVGGWVPTWVNVTWNAGAAPTLLTTAEISYSLEFIFTGETWQGFVADAPSSITDEMLTEDYQRIVEKGVANGYASLGADGLVPAAQLPAAVVPPTATTAVQGLVLVDNDSGGSPVALTAAGHGADADPHPQYTTAAELAAAITAHEAAVDPHTGYQRESEKSAANGYASLDASGDVPIGELPVGTIAGTVAAGDHNHAGVYDPAGTAAAAVAAHEAAADPHPQYAMVADVNAAFAAHAADADPHPVYTTAAELAAAITAHEGAADPHTGYQREAEKGVANGYASLDANVLVPEAQLPTLFLSDSAVSPSIALPEGTWDVMVHGWGYTASATSSVQLNAGAGSRAHGAGHVSVSGDAAGSTAGGDGAPGLGSYMGFGCSGRITAPVGGCTVSLTIANCGVCAATMIAIKV